MIKIAILTPRNSYLKIKEAVDEISKKVDYIFYDNLTDLGDIYLTLAHKYNGIITSGPIGYEIIKQSVKIITPLYFLEISKSDLFKSLFKILKLNPNINFSRVFIDLISENEREKWLEDILDKKENPILFTVNYDNKLYENLKNKYLYLKNNNKIDFALTRVSNILPFLEENNIPFEFLFPSKETIKKIVIESIKDIKAKKFDQKQLIFGKINCFIEKEIVKDFIISKCKNCIVQEKKENLELLVLKDDFYSSEIFNLIKERFKFSKDCYIGWGLGNNIGEARIYAEESLKKNIQSYGEIVTLISENKVVTLSEIKKEQKKELDIIEKLNSLNITGEKVKILVEMLTKEKEITSSKLGLYMNISERTANRILNKLYENNIVTVSIEKIQRGRPKKIYELI